MRRNTQVEKGSPSPEAKAAAAAISSFSCGSGGGEGGFAEATQQRLPHIFSDLRTIRGKKGFFFASNTDVQCREET